MTFFGKFDPTTGESSPLTHEDYINVISDLHLAPHVPKDVTDLFETAKALYAYGYLYWTFFTLSFEQALKAWELAITKRLELTGQAVPNRLIDKIEALHKYDVISEDIKKLFHMTRMVRNDLVHPDTQNQLGHSISWIRGISRDINFLFGESEAKSSESC